jgi:hypothetical protein
VVVADNGSTDGSQALALAEGARIVEVAVRGYGAALRCGIAEAWGRYVIMADADDSYALNDLEPFVTALRSGADLVMGNRFRGGIARGAMPFLHRHLGNPVLSFCGRMLFDVPIGDFHCGMRGFRRDRILGLGLRTNGMEFASEMVVRAALSRLDIREVPTTLRPDGRSRGSHLNTWRDGWRHLRFLLALSPRWLLLYPSLILTATGLAVLVFLSFGQQQVGDVAFDVHTMLAAATAVVVGVQTGGLAVISRAYAAALGLLPKHTPMERMLERLTIGRGIILGGVMTLAGIGCFVVALLRWRETGFGELDATSTMRLPILGMGLIVVGVQIVLVSFVLSLTRIGEN